MTRDKESHPTPLIGIDLGAATVKVAIRRSDDAPVRGVRVPAKGRPLSALREAIEGVADAIGGDAVRVAITGMGQPLLNAEFPHIAANEVVATALGARAAFPDARTVIDIGAQLAKWIRLGDGKADEDAVADFATNGLCAAGSGSFLEQQASRLHLTVNALGRLAASARSGVPIAGRCSVFAKSDMIHLQQKGTPVDFIAYGLCQAMARTFAVTVMNGQTAEPPVVLVGGGGAIPGMVRAFREILGLSDGELRLPEDPFLVGAIGAASMARAAPTTDLGTMLSVVDDRIVDIRQARESGAPPLPSLSQETSEVPTRDADDIDAAALPKSGPIETYLGVDVGSVSTNFVVLDKEMQVLQGIYLATRGRPVDVLDEGLQQIRQRFGDRLLVLGVGTTGSGRHLAEQILGADEVHNEITAQMVAAAHAVPGVDTIFEIGGQDSKYISVRDGRLADFEMNKICAAGTGSFLEEQADRLGIAIIDEFSDLAMRAERPCDLGARCTVFTDTELVRAQERGAHVVDLCAGLAYSVARNYLEKVVAGRAIGKRIVFAGGTASNRAVVGAFERLLKQPIHVHPHNRVSGAIGAALLAARAHRQGEFPTSRFRGLNAGAGAEVSIFECKACENRCQVNRIRLGDRTVHFGDACERFSSRDRDRAVVSRPFDELFTRWDSLMDAAVGAAVDGADGPPVGLLRASINLEYQPLWATLLRRLGFRPVLAEHTTPSLLRHHGGGVPAEVCLPIKVAVAQARELLGSGKIERLFVPSVVEASRPGAEEEAFICFYAQQLADTLRAEFGERVVAPKFTLEAGILSAVDSVRVLAHAFDLSNTAVALAFRAAWAAQSKFDEARRALGREALTAPFERAVVVLGKPYNTHDPFLNLSLGRHLARLGLPAIPWDVLDLDSITLDDRWRTIPWRYSRDQLKTIDIIHRDSRLFPVLVSSYGCGPDGFVVKHIEELLADRPRLLLEFDEHRGEAGLVTRLEAFADEIHEYLLAGETGDEGARLTPGPAQLDGPRHIFVSNFSIHAEVYAAVLRSAGFDASVLPRPDQKTIRIGEEQASGRECHPYAIIAGELARAVSEDKLADDAVFFIPSTVTPCLLRQYGDGMRIMLDRMGVPDVAVWDIASADMVKEVGIAGVFRLYEGVLAVDILLTLAVRLRPYEREQGAIDALLAGGVTRIVDAVEHREGVADALEVAAFYLWACPSNGEPGYRPVVGVTGDLYTRMNEVGNADLFRRLEEMGCEAWPSPYFASIIDLSAKTESSWHALRGRFGSAAKEWASLTITSNVRSRFIKRLPPDVAELCVEAPPETILKLAKPYLSLRSNHLVQGTVGKIADFLSRGADGAINACGHNCMVGTATAAVIPRIREDHGGAPVVTLVYGGVEGPGQRIRLETFVHQVLDRGRRKRNEGRMRR